jgi:phage baseplate assembly protein W
MATRLFKDIDLSFVPHPTTGDLLAKFDEEAIKNAVKNLVLTKHYERAFHSEIGSSVSGLLFEIASPGLEIVLKQEIADVINNFEPRVELLDIEVLFTPDANSVQVTITFRIRNTTRPIVVRFALNRTR